MYMYVSIVKTKCDLVQFKPFIHYCTIITRGKVLIKIPLLNLCKADLHPFINGHHLMFVWFNYKYTHKYVMSVYISDAFVIWIFPFYLPDCAADKKYSSLIGRS